MQVLRSHSLHPARERGGEEQALGRRRRLRLRRNVFAVLLHARDSPNVLEDLLHVLLKPHIQHPVRLVQHNTTQTSCLQRSPFQMVHQPSRCPHHELRTPTQSVDLRLDWGASIHRLHSVLVRVLDLVQDVAHLQGQFSGRHDYHHQVRLVARSPSGLQDPFSTEAFHQRQHVGQGLPAPRQIPSHDVLAVVYEVECLLLDRKQLHDVRLLQNLNSSSTYPVVLDLCTPTSGHFLGCSSLPVHDTAQLLI